MKRFAITLQLFLPLFGLLAAEAPEHVITFEDVPHNSTVENGYTGLNWTNVSVFDTTVYPTPSGYLKAAVSPGNVAINGHGLPATVSSNAPFDILSGHFTAAWRNDLLLTVTAYRGGSEVSRQEYFLQTTGPSFLPLNLFDVDQVVFSTSGGTDAGYIGNGTHFAVDDLTVKVPGFVPPGPEELLATAMERVASLEAGGKLNRGQATSLTAKLQAAKAAMERGNTEAACKLLQAAANEVRGYVAAGLLGPVDGASLLDAIVQTGASLGCGA